MIIYTIVCVFSLFISRNLYKNRINPISLYTALWFICVALNQSQLIYFSELSTETWGVLIASQLFYVLGCVAGHYISKVKFSFKIKKRSFNDQCVMIKRTILVTTCLASIEIVRLFIDVVSYYGLNYLNYVTELYKIDLYNKSSGFSLEAFIFISITLTGIYLKRYGFQKFVLFPVIICIMSQLTSGSRGSFIACIALFISSFLMDNVNIQKIKNKRAFKFLIIGMLFIVMLNTFGRVGDRDLTGKYASDFLINSPFSSILYSLIFYFASPISGLNELITLGLRGGFGTQTFRIPLLLFGVENPSFNLTVYTPVSTNVFSYLGTLFYDFGYGYIIAVFILAFIFSLSYQKCKRTTSILWNILYAVGFSIVLMSFFSFFLNVAIFWYVIFFGLFFSIFFIDNKFFS